MFGNWCFMGLFHCFCWWKQCGLLCLQKGWCWVNILNFVQSNEFPWAVWSCWWHCKYLDILIFGVYLNVRLLFKLSKFLTNSDVHKSTINFSFRISLPVKTTWIVTSTFGIVEKVLKVYGHNIFVLNYSC